MPNQRGSILIITLFILSFLSALALNVGYQLQGRLALTSRHKERLESFYLARGILFFIIETLEEDKQENKVDHPGEDWFSAYHRKDIPTSLDFSDINGTIKGKYTVGIHDESSKLNINIVDESTLKNLLQQFKGVDAPKLAKDIITYRKQKGTFKKFFSVYELLRIKGIDKDLFLGEDTNENRILDPWEDNGDKSLPHDNHNGKLDLGLKDYLTVYTDGKININTASLTILLSMPGMRKDMVNALLDARRIDPIKSLDDLKEMSFMTAKAFQHMSRWATVQSDWFKIPIQAKIKKAKTSRQILAVVDRSSLPAKIRYWRED